MGAVCLCELSNLKILIIKKRKKKRKSFDPSCQVGWSEAATLLVISKSRACALVESFTDIRLLTSLSGWSSSESSSSAPFFLKLVFKKFLSIPSWSQFTRCSTYVATVHHWKSTSIDQSGRGWWTCNLQHSFGLLVGLSHRCSWYCC